MKKIELKVTPYAKFWRLNGYAHRDNDQPATIFYCGRKDWYKNGHLHRENGPAVIYNYDRQDWFYNGKLIKYIKYGVFTSCIR